MVSPKSVSSAATKSCVSWRLWVWNQTFQRIYTTWSRRLSLSASIWNVIARTWTANSVWFLLNRESTGWLVSTKQRVYCHQHGNTNPAPLQLWSHKHNWNMWKVLNKHQKFNKNTQCVFNSMIWVERINQCNSMRMANICGLRYGRKLGKRQIMDYVVISCSLLSI